MPVNISDFTILSQSNESSVLASIFSFVKKKSRVLIAHFKL